MEIEEIKILIENEASKLATKPAKNISHILREKPTGPIAGLAASIRIEMITTFIFLCIASALPFFIPVAFIQFVAAGTILYILFFLRYLMILQKEIRHFGREIMSTHQSVRNIIGMMERFTRLYFQFCMIFIPVLFVISLAFFLFDNPVYHVHPFMLFQLKTFRLFSAGFFIWGIFMYFFARWYIKEMYGQPLTALKEQLTELDAS